MDGELALERIIEVIKRNEPDVVALQEVDSRRLENGARSPFELLQEAVGEHGVASKIDRHRRRRLWPDADEPLAAERYRNP